VLNIQWHDKEKEYETDIYILNEFANAASVYTEIKKSGLFSCVYLLKPLMFKSQNSMIRGMGLIWGYLHPESVVRWQLGEAVHRFPTDFYDVIMASVNVVFIASLCKLNPKAEFFMFDDGLGSYYGNLAGGGWKYKLFTRIFRQNDYAAIPQKLYVNNAGMCKSKAAVKIEQLPSWDKDFLTYVYKVFSVEPQKSRVGQRVIFLSQPFEDIDISKSFNAVMELLTFVSEDVLIRFHPREAGRKVPEKIRTDHGSVMWELTASMTDMDDKILVGYYSTAQMTPKILFDQEPWLIFLYRIDKNLFDERMKKSLDIMVEDLRANYRDKGKIFIPDSIEDFKEQLNSLMKRR